MSTARPGWRFDDEGNILAADIDFVQDVGAYPTPYPVLTTAAIGMFFPGPYRVPKASFNYKTVFSNTAGLAAYRGPWQYETLTREILLDIARARWTWTQSSCAAATSCAATRCRTSTPTACRTTTSLRRTPSSRR